MKYPAPLQAVGQLAGLDEAPKGMDGEIGISERGKVRTWSRSQGNEASAGKAICIIYCPAHLHLIVRYYGKCIPLKNHSQEISDPLRGFLHQHFTGSICVFLFGMP